MKTIQNFRTLLCKNLSSIFFFELFVELFLFCIFIPVWDQVFTFSLHLAGLYRNTLAFQTLPRYLLSPATWLLLPLLLLFAAFLTYCETYGLVLFYHASQHRLKLTVLQVWRRIFLDLPGFLKRRKRGFLLFLLLIIPFSRQLLYPVILSQMLMPDFLIDTIASKLPLLILFLLFIMLNAVIAFLGTLSLHYFYLEHLPFGIAWRQSAKKIIRHFWKSLLLVLAACILSSLLSPLLDYLKTVILVQGQRFLKEESEAYAEFHVMILYAQWFLELLLPLISVQLSYAVTSQMYRHYKRKDGEDYPSFTPSPIQPERGYRIRKNLIIAGLLLSTVSGLFLHFYDRSRNGQAITMASALAEVKSVEITAHRGASSEYVENTLPAFERAIELGADWIELDVQQMADGTLLLNHDNTLRRVAGLNRYIWDLNWEDIMDLKLGSSSLSEQPTPCTLEDALLLCKDRILVNVEIKANPGHDTDLVPSILSVIDQLDMQDQVIIASLRADILKEVKELNPEYRTALILYLTPNHYNDLDYADVFSINRATLTADDVEEIHQLSTASGQQKELWAWTANDTSSISSLYRMGVDNIITDNISLAYDAIMEELFAETLYTYINSDYNQHLANVRKILRAIYRQVI